MLEYVSSTTDKGQQCAKTGTANHRYIWAEKEEESTSSCLTFLVSDQTRFPRGHISWWLLSNPYSICPCKTPPAQLPHFWLPDPSTFSTSWTFHDCPKALPYSDSLSKILPVSLYKSAIPTFLSKLLLSCILLLTAQWFSVSCISRTSISPSLSRFSITMTTGHWLLSPFPQSSQLTSSILPSPTASSFSHTPLHWHSANFFPLTPCSIICVCPSSQLLPYLFLKQNLSTFKNSGLGFFPDMLMGWQEEGERLNCSHTTQTSSAPAQPSPAPSSHYRKSLALSPVPGWITPATHCWNSLCSTMRKYVQSWSTLSVSRGLLYMQPEIVMIKKSNRKKEIKYFNC